MKIRHRINCKDQKHKSIITINYEIKQMNGFVKDLFLADIAFGTSRESNDEI